MPQPSDLYGIVPSACQRYVWLNRRGYYGGRVDQSILTCGTQRNNLARVGQ